MKKDFWLQVDIDDVLQTMSCYKTSPNYDECVGACRQLMVAHDSQFRATGWMVLKNQERADSLVVLDPSLDKTTKELFHKGDYLEGMLLNTIADQLLFTAADQMEKEMARELALKGLFLKNRKEPGSAGVPLDEVVQILEAIKRDYDLEVNLTEGYMMDPVKSSAHYYELDQDSASCLPGRACDQCDLEQCQYRKIPLRVFGKTETKTHFVTKGTNLLDALRRFGYAIEAPCGGKGTCKKCKVENLTDQGPIWVYACRTIINEPSTIRLQNDEKGQVLSDYRGTALVKPKAPMPGKVAFGVDIGTTTVVVQCLCMDNHELLDEERYYNPQRPYGADVISRIQYEHETGSKVLSELIRKSIGDSVRNILSRLGRTELDVEEIAITGNTVMLYLLEGRDAYDLSVSPFHVDDPSRKVKNGKLLDLSESIRITLMPVISAYVGGDIVSGFYASDFLKLTGNVLYLDVGTNGEIALISKGRVVTASTAAGPAFEGANISCGVASIDGAVCQLDYKAGIWNFLTIADKPPIGLNGSALIDLMAICLKQGWVDETGYMAVGESVSVELGGSVFQFTNADVRQLQLAKAAIAAGVRALIEEVGISVEDLDGVYMAGGFGSHLNVEHAIDIGLLPKIAAERVSVWGNAALGGAIRFIIEENAEEAIDTLAQECDYIELSMHSRFNDLYIEEMLFPLTTSS